MSAPPDSASGQKGGNLDPMEPFPILVGGHALVKGGEW